MTENQKLREALQAISHIDDTTNHTVDASAALDRIGQIARQALALPTAPPLSHKPGCPADGGYGNGPEPCICGAAPVGDLADLPRYTAWSHLKTHGRWPEGIDRSWMKDEMGRYNDVTVSNAVIAELRAALSAGDAGWQPIETAPKDGSDCWLLVEEEVRRGFWVEIEFEERRDLDGRYIDQTDDYAYWMDKDSGDSLEPTMFYPITKPLPPAPAMRKGQL